MIRKFKLGDDYFDHVFDDMAMFFPGYHAPNIVFTEGEFYNPVTHELVPKKSFLEQEIKIKEKRLQELKQRRDNEKTAYENQEKSLTLEIEQLKQRL
jgi:hypothetical protein